MESTTRIQLFGTPRITMAGQTIMLTSSPLAPAIEPSGVRCRPCRGTASIIALFMLLTHSL